MVIRTNKYTEKNEGSKVWGKTLPNTFMDNDSNFWGFLAASIVLHPLCIGLLWLAFIILTLLGFSLPSVQKPELANKDIEFVLTQNEEKPINKNTKYRSDKDSRAGGEHDPKRKVSMPSPSPAPAPKQVAQPQPVVQPKAAPKQVQKPIQKPVPVQKPVVQQKPALKPAMQPQKTVSKPTRPMAPAQRPVLKPSTATPRPQMPKLATAPSSPFKIAVPKTNAPVGKGFSTGGGTASSGGSVGSATSGGSSGRSGMPAPQFSTTRVATSNGASRGAAGGTRGGSGHGGYGTGNMGNPGPGNRSGAPGIDAIKSPQWGPYMRELEGKIKRNWHPPKGDQSKRVVLLFKIGRRGELLSVRVAKPSGSQANDEAAKRAVQLSAPFRALPPEFTGSSVEIEFTFDYNVLGASYR